MGILSRFKDIMASNINAALDHLEDPSKMVDQYLINAKKDFAAVKSETASIMAEQSRVQRLVNENRKEAEKYTQYAEKALIARNDDDARVFLSKKQEIEGVSAGFATSLAVATENANKMRLLHDKLAKDIQDLESKKNMIKSKAAVAKTQERINKFNMPDTGRTGMEAFNRLEAKVDKKLDAANAMAELNSAPVDEAKALEEKYKSGAVAASVESELDAMRKRLNIN